MRYTVGQLVTALATVVAASALSPAAASSPTPANATCATHHPYAGWTEVDLPSFPTSTFDRNATRMTTWVVDQGTPGRVFVSDGLSVLRTTDFGCSWKTVMQVQVPAVWDDEEQVVAYLAAPGGNRVYVGTEIGDVQLLYTSSDGGATFRRVSGPATPYALPRAGAIATSPANPKRAYLVGEDPLYLERTDDGGATWATVPTPEVIGTATTGFVTVDPANADVVYLWASGAAGLYRSRDAGVHFTEISQTVTPYNGPSSLAVLHVSGAPSLLAATATQGLVACNTDCSLSGAVPGPPKVQITGLAQSPTGDKLTLFAGSTLYRYNAVTGRSTDITPPTADTLHMPQVDATSRHYEWTATTWNLYYRAA